MPLTSHMNVSDIVLSQKRTKKIFFLSFKLLNLFIYYQMSSPKKNFLVSHL